MKNNYYCGESMTIVEMIERIAYIRCRANLSARKLSILIGKNAGYIHSLETHKSFAPTFDTLADILEACNTSFVEFFYYDIKEYAQDREIIEQLKKVKDAEKKKAFLVLLGT